MRCYNGAPDDELKAYLDDQAKCDAELAAVGLTATYFPVEQAWMVFDADYHPLTDVFYRNLRVAMDAALTFIKEPRP